MPSFLTLIVLTILNGSFAHQLNSRSVSRSGEGASVNLIEFNVKGTIYGRCSFRLLNEMITVTYEETDDNMIAKSENPTVVDPVEKTKACRNLASHKPTLGPQTRSELANKTPETELELYSRLKDYEIANAQNQDYVESLKPKFFNFLSNAVASSFGNYGISFGGAGSNGGFNIGLPTVDTANYGATIGGGNSIFKWFGKRRR